METDSAFDKDFKNERSPVELPTGVVVVTMQFISEQDCRRSHSLGASTNGEGVRGPDATVSCRFFNLLTAVMLQSGLTLAAPA